MYVYSQTRSAILRALTVVTGTTSAICLAGIAFTPADTSPLHGTFVNDAFLALIGFLAVIAAAQWRDQGPRWAPWMMAANCVVVVLFFASPLMLLASTPDMQYVGAVLAQKILVYVCLANLTVQSIVLSARYRIAA
jgi:hypothetical protein